MGLAELQQLLSLYHWVRSVTSPVRVLLSVYCWLRSSRQSGKVSQPFVQQVWAEGDLASYVLGAKSNDKVEEN